MKEEDKDENGLKELYKEVSKGEKEFQKLSGIPPRPRGAVYFGDGLFLTEDGEFVTEDEIY